MNKRPLITLLTLALVMYSMCSFGQKGDDAYTVTVISLSEVITMTKRHSPAYFYAVNYKENRYWQWRTYKANYMPQLSISGNLPDFNRSYTPVTQPDGNIAFRSVSYVNSNVSLNLSQNIGLTGGKIFTSSQLRRFDNLFDTLKVNKNRYSGNPVMIGISQPLLGFNQLLWDKRIEPLKYEESQKEFIESLENVSVEATTAYFRLLLAQISLEIAKKNLSNNDTLYRIAQSRFKLGKVDENDLLQLELSIMNARQAIARAQLDVKTNTLALKIYTGMLDVQQIHLSIPDSIPDFEVSEDLALIEAQKNRGDVISYKRRMMEAERDIAMAKSNSGLQANLTATYGLTNAAPTFPEMYNNPLNQQSLTVGFQIPIVDWGRSKARMKTAEANQKLVKNTIEQDEINFIQQVYTQVELYKMLKEQINITRKSDEIAQKRYDNSKNRYLLGKVGITDMNIA